MRPEQWDVFKKAARLEKIDRVPMALIIDSPWIPGYLGLSHMDFYLDPEVWFQAHLQLHREFPGIMFIPPWWMEYGMAAEPSALGARIKFWPGSPPGQSPMLFRIEDIENLPHVDVERDGYMALALHRMHMHRRRILDHGYILPLVASRGPLCTAAFARGTTEFMMDLIDRPEWAHRLLDITTRLAIDWIEAQAEACGPGVEGFLLLDDIVGFVNEDCYAEFCHPYLKRICDAFPRDWIKIYHNDASIEACLEHLPDAGFNVLNWGKQTGIAAVKARVGDRICLMGNVPPLEIGVRGTPEQVRAATLDVLEKSGGRGIILSTGGGVSPGMPRANILAMQEALAEYNDGAVRAPQKKKRKKQPAPHLQKP
ncbi:MAG: uroporphyrinogen decarboxylase family protein [Opitutaceae bacterium]|jgi:uroporphyrinogen decarboxylase|nr:uroporphyrinogen decarboxylase family protein [Opitutaceae bacterium]